jgi:hypothetical protein
MVVVALGHVVGRKRRPSVRVTIPERTEEGQLRELRDDGGP